MKRTSLIAILTCYLAMASGQSFYTLETGKTIGTKYVLPYAGLSYGFKKDLFTGEVGLKTNFQEYYTLAFLSFGAETKGKLLVGANFGIGTTFNLPRNDRVYVDGRYEYISKGFDKNSITAIYTNAKLGYMVLNGVYAYAGYSYSYDWSWATIGIKLTSIQ